MNNSPSCTAIDTLAWLMEGDRRWLTSVRALADDSDLDRERLTNLGDRLPTRDIIRILSASRLRRSVRRAADDNDSLDYTDGWDGKDAQLVDKLFGDDPLSRWEAAEAIYQEEGANVQFLLIDGVGHDRKALQKYSTEFFKKVLNDE